MVQCPSHILMMIGYRLHMYGEIITSTMGLKIYKMFVESVRKDKKIDKYVN